MTNDSALPHSSRLRRLGAEVAKFGAVGGAGVLVNLLTFNIVRHATSVPVVRASIIATIVAIVFNYIGFRYFTYRDREKTGRTRELILFAAFSVVGLVIENGVLYLGTYGFGLDTPLQSNVMKFVGIGVATLFRFWSYRSWVFRTLPAPDPVAQAESVLTVAEPHRGLVHGSLTPSPVVARGGAPEGRTPGRPGAGPGHGRNGRHRAARHARVD
ncbi:GtrA family protein [Streptomyces sp. NPDC049954]|uniref:GtrA family protein n=1 Tax=Streptomyces sp. NPDC049954 TaxID=3155779 RepID=UPI003421770E